MLQDEDALLHLSSIAFSKFLELPQGTTVTESPVVNTKPIIASTTTTVVPLETAATKMNSNVTPDNTKEDKKDQQCDLSPVRNCLGGLGKLAQVGDAIMKFVHPGASSCVEDTLAAVGTLGGVASKKRQRPIAPKPAAAVVPALPAPLTAVSVSTSASANVGVPPIKKTPAPRQARIHKKQKTAEATDVPAISAPAPAPVPILLSVTPVKTGIVPVLEDVNMVPIEKTTTSTAIDTTAPKTTTAPSTAGTGESTSSSNEGQLFTADGTPGSSGCPAPSPSPRALSSASTGTGPSTSTRPRTWSQSSISTSSVGGTSTTTARTVLWCVGCHQPFMICGCRDNVDEPEWAEFKNMIRGTLSTHIEDCMMLVDQFRINAEQAIRKIEIPALLRAEQATIQMEVGLKKQFMDRKEREKEQFIVKETPLPSSLPLVQEEKAVPR